AYRMNLYEQIIRPLVSPCLAKDPGFTYNWPLVDEPVRRILETRPANLLPPEHADWKAFLRSCLLQTLQSIEHSSSGKGIETSWGDINRAAIAHPLALGAPALGRILNMPADPLAGHPSAIRTTIPNYGASMRMVVSPGHEERGLLHMIAGQSGHLLSAHYADSHKAWVEGLPTPFLPGDVVETLVLTPKQ
ncbi:MAG TPA: penicillin acylase family protein, partial [Blastocatellia bacterium]